MTPVTTFGALDSGTGFTFHTVTVLGFPADTVFTKHGAFTFTNGKKVLTLGNPKTAKVVPVAPNASFLNSWEWLN